MDRLKNKVCLVTGAASNPGLGYATAMLFAQEGARLVITDIDEPGLEACATVLVITSYSIHYTKLYDTTACTRPVHPFSETPGRISCGDRSSRQPGRGCSPVPDPRHKATVCQDRLHSACRPSAPPPGDARKTPETRITSYNVCYTKLLRTTSKSVPPLWVTITRWPLPSPSNSGGSKPNAISPTLRVSYNFV